MSPSDRLLRLQALTQAQILGEDLRRMHGIILHIAIGRDYEQAIPPHHPMMTLSGRVLKIAVKRSSVQPRRVIMIQLYRSLQEGSTCGLSALLDKAKCC